MPLLLSDIVGSAGCNGSHLLKLFLHIEHGISLSLLRIGPFSLDSHKACLIDARVFNVPTYAAACHPRRPSCTYAVPVAMGTVSGR